MYYDNITRIAVGLLKNRHRAFSGTADSYPISFGMLEIDHLIDDTISTINVSEDWGHMEEINRPDIYGYYRDGNGWEHTLDDVALCTVNEVKLAEVVQGMY